MTDFRLFSAKLSPFFVPEIFSQEDYIMVDCEIYADNSHSTQIISQKLLELCKNYDDLAFVFIGTDANIGDSLGPICGELTADLRQNCFFYGNLKHTITAKDVPFLCDFIKKTPFHVYRGD